MSAQLMELPTNTPTATVVSVTPEVAERWLAQNTHNRNLRTATVAQYARDMRDGQWRFTGEAVKFASDGTLLDGQHRLHAIVQSGVTVQVLVVNNLPVEAQDVMDSGAKRQASDALKLNGYKNVNVLSAASRLALGVESIRRNGTRDLKRSYSNPEILEFVEANPSMQDAATIGTHYRDLIDAAPSVIAYAWWACSRISATATQEFFETVATSATTGKGDPRSALIRRLTTARRNGEYMSQFAQVSLILRAWNAWRKGQQMERLQVENRNGDAIPIPVPR